MSDLLHEVLVRNYGGACATIELDANGLPKGYRLGLLAASRALADFINELPDATYRLGPTDGEEGAMRMFSAFWIEVRKAQEVKP